MRIKELVAESHGNALDRGFWENRCIDDPVEVASMLALIHSEVSEALECIRESNMGLRYDIEGKPVGFDSEIADIVIRIGDLCGGMRIDLTAALIAKMKYNRRRSHRHGGKAL